MSSKKEQLENSNKALRDSLDAQISNLKDKFGDAGKNALLIGGGLVTVYAVVKMLSKSKKKKKAKKVLIQQTEPSKKEVVVSNPVPKRSNMLTDTVKEQLIIFLLGIAAERLGKFLSSLDDIKETDDSK